MGKAFAKKLRGFDVEVLCDILENVGNANAKQVSLDSTKVRCAEFAHSMDSTNE
jgi:hypothetical protein